jgi:DNA topoisomerase-2
LEQIVDVLFHKEDLPILKYTEDDGVPVEPENYLPVVPLLAINGSVGIGTGFSTDIPPHNPSEVVTLIEQRIRGERKSLSGLSLKPWWYGFKGPVLPNGEDTWITKGLYTLDDTKRTVTISELPVGTWTKDYKVFLDSMCVDDKSVMKSFDDLYDDDTVRFVLYMENDYYEDIKADMAEFEKRFKLTTSWKLSNMTCFDAEMKIVKFSTVGDILEAYYVPRLVAYETRRVREMERLEKDALEADAKARFLRAVLEGSLDLRKATDEEIVDAMVKHSLPPISDPEFPDTVDAYEYLLKLRMDRVKASAIKDAEDSVLKARMAYELLRDTTASALWLEDLQAFKAAWETMQKTREKAGTTGPKKKPTKRTG